MPALHIFRGLDEARQGFAPSAVTIGNFDGVHAGHRQLMRRTREIAAELGVKASALTFHPHPATIVAPERAPRLLTTPDERCALMAAEGIEQVLILPFDHGIAAHTPEQFFERVLVGDLGARAVIVGDNFHYGRGQSGHIRDLRELGERLGVRVEIVPLLSLRGGKVSSSEVRRLLGAGDVSMAARLLQRPYSLSGSVVRGEGRGSTQTVPTLNLETRSLEDSTSALPADGVYITRTEDPDSSRAWNSITNIGYRPTFEGRHLTIETYLLGALTGATPARIRLEFLRRVRPERRFDSAAALKEQILRDVGRAQAFFRRTQAMVNSKQSASAGLDAE
ncbi:MAG: riboflavin biosynthesis protein RibF [Bryobacterales bacterium]|nr:riboflavin biosynthesis protein RibF [Bryobacterales bacterium]